MNECEIWSYKGCSNIETAKILVAYIKKHNNACKILIHRDKDCLSDEEIIEYCSKLEGDKIKCFIPNYPDIESLFCDKIHFMELYPNIQEDEIDNFIKEVYDEKKDTLKEKLINSRVDYLRKKGENCNVGAVSVEYTNKFDQDPRRWSNGKIIMSGLNGNYRNKYGNNLDLKRKSNFLKQNEIIEFLNN